MQISVQPEDSAEHIDSRLQAFWELEHLGILDRQQPNVDDDMVLQDFRSTVKLEEGRYVVRLLWDLEKRSALRDSKQVADLRLKTITKKLLSNHAVMQEYDNTIREYLTGHAERVLDVETVSGPLYYMPHHAVFRRERETTKVRIVFDASSKASGCVSLNETVHAEPNLNSDILDLLLQLRTY